MHDLGERAITVTALKHAIPYIRMFKGKIFVIKVGGGVFEDAGTTRALMEQVATLHQVGIRTVLVHGGGPQSTHLARSLGLEPRFVDGRRVTDDKALEISTMVLNGTVNTRVVAACRDLGVHAVGISGVDAGLIRARRRPPVRRSDEEEAIDYGHVGDIEEVEPAALLSLLDAGLMPVVSPLSADASGALLNINGDTVASALAASLRAEKLILVTGAPGILEREGDATSLVSYTDLAGLEGLERQGSLSAGMLPKARAVETALRGGVPRVHLISYQVADSLLLEIFTNEGVGTLVVAEVEALSRDERLEA